ncbi:MAG: rRNA maturation RNase YbeY [Oscillospiraceae bacterium]|jgi:probable rRNA maturation factor|nr:rRNA maturation RNase YbeY [Oscillospiraceae bacterium]
MPEEIHRIYILDRQKNIKLPVGLRMIIRRTCHASIEVEKLAGPIEVNVIIVDDTYMRSLNAQYRGIDKTTDVLSFSNLKDGKYDINPETGRQMLGDIIVSIVKMQEQALENYNSFEQGVYQEAVRLVSHGMFHLLGYDHERDNISRDQMRELEGRVLNFMGFSESVVYI